MNTQLIDHPKIDGLKIVCMTIIGLFVLELIRTAWVCDDAYITFRTIDNFINGYGLRWNINERVQSYTHPLWMFLLSVFYFFTREIYLTSIVISIALSLTSIYLLAFKIAQSSLSALLILLILIFSKAFVDFSTSGLENPLTYFLFALFFLVYLKKDSHSQKTIFWLALIAALAMLNRLDNILLLIPTLTLVLWQNRSWKTIGIMTVGFIPFFIWELFSIVYYGFFFPNTAYAKLNTGIPSQELLQEGINYIRNSFSKDPITLSTIGTVFILPFLTKQWKLLPLVLGISLSIIYTIKIGGDFMSGRFLTASLFTAVIVLSQYPISAHSSRLVSISTLGIILLLVYFSASIVLGGKNIASSGIIDERNFYYQHTGLLRTTEHGALNLNHPWKFEGQVLRETLKESKITTVVRSSIGFLGFYAGSDIHIIDPYSLSDTFLARFPTIPHQWRIGHFLRTVPQDYFESVKQGKNLFIDKKLSHFYQQISLVTRGEFFSVNRWRAIWLLNFGNYQKLLERGNYSDKYTDKKINNEMSLASFNMETWVFTLPEIKFSDTETYTAKLLPIFPGVMLFKVGNFSQMLNNCHYYDSNLGRIYLPNVKILIGNGKELNADFEFILIDQPLTENSYFAVTFFSF